MTDRPVIFSAPMVQALLIEAAEQGTGKSQTRRLATVRGKKSPWQKVAPGDRLWVRENLRVGRETLLFSADDHIVPKGSFAWQDWYYKYGERQIPCIHMPRWASRLTLIVTAVRIERLQEITEQDAEREGVVYESADPAFTYVPGILPHSITAVGMEQMRFGPMEVVSFSKLWNHINGAGAWEANPEVVAVSFTVRKRNIDAVAP